MLGDMAAVKTRIGLLYQQDDSETCKRLSAELASRCPDVELSADVVVDDNIGLLMTDAMPPNSGGRCFVKWLRPRNSGA